MAYFSPPTLVGEVSGFRFGAVISTLDFSRDGRPDLLVANGYGDTATAAPQFSLLVQQADGSFALDTTSAVAQTLPSMFVPVTVEADFNNDGIVDLALTDYGYKDFSLPSTDPNFNNFLLQPAFVFLSSSAGYQVSSLASVNLHSKGMDAGDIDGDGDVDILLDSGGGGTISGPTILLNNGAGQFEQVSDRIPQFQNINNSAALGDFNGDGALDLVFGPERENSVNATPDTLENARGTVLLNDGTGDFNNSAVIKLPLPSFNDGFVVASAIDTTDLNGDGFDDVLISHSRQILAGQNEPVEPDPAYDGTGRYLQILISDGNGGFVDETATRLGPQTDEISPLTATGGYNLNTASNGSPLFLDVNGDGHQDIFVNTSQSFSSTNPLLYLNYGDGTFAAIQTNFVPQNVTLPISGLLSDLNNDSRIDAVSSYGSDAVVIETLLGADTTVLNTLPDQPNGLNSGLSQIYRFYNTETGAHFYTNSVLERNQVLSELPNFVFEANAFDTNVTTSNGDAVYRFYNSSNGTHFYTISDEERESVMNSIPHFQYEGIAYYADANGSDSSQKLYRFYNEAAGTHFYTTSADERDSIISTLGHYTYEGIAFYVDLA
ncbi:VCBS repeat-containing protein [Labrenzia sp. R4_2]|uniref:FG-GAP-like repeat-containing protein n=1 Tax=Labrenzia sp. R4_2 TaxID=2821107 RepID=UPI001ADC3448|nr:FG-GAP-like repeat-containing protein [Labrenzia sp. R4_2]MBO9418499.1 VCBS repeat-containing protein [Labrenzia sp. R4_2]